VSTAIAGTVHLDYAAEDARDIANAPLESQKAATDALPLCRCRRSDLPNGWASHIAILDALDAIARRIQSDGSDQDLAVILVSSHGEMIDGRYYSSPITSTPDHRTQARRPPFRRANLRKK
jgi:hypothetical protein